MLIFAVRHGQTDWNLSQRFQGRTDIPLNATGLLQAREIGEALVPFAIQRVVTSPLVRAQTTGRVISDAVGLSGIETEERLIERCMGDCEGAYISQRPNYFSIWDADDGSMEPLGDVRCRMVESIRSLGSGAGPVVAVSHGAALNALLTEVSGGVVGTGVTRLVNCCVNVLGLDEDSGNIVLLAYNLAPASLADWASAQGKDILRADATNTQRLAALKTPVTAPTQLDDARDTEQDVRSVCYTQTN